MAIRKTLRGSTHRNRTWRKLLYNFVQTPNQSMTSTFVKIKYFQPKFEKIIHNIKTKMTLNLMRKMVSLMYDDILSTKKLINIVNNLALRSGGYTRVLKSNYRLSDGALMGIISFSDNVKRIKLQ